MKIVSKQRNSRMCYICGMENPAGLAAQFYSMEDGSVVTLFRFREEHQSFPGRVHGGLAASMLDELGLRAIWAKSSEDVFGVTMSMEVKYRKPVPYGEELAGRGIVVRETPKFAVIRSELLDRGGVCLAEAQVRYLKLEAGQIAQNADPHEEMCYLIKDDLTEISLF